MVKVTLILIALIGALFAPAGNTVQTSLAQSQAQASASPSTPPESVIKVTIATGGGSLGPPQNRYRVGDQIPIGITMTNTSSGPLYACISSDLYQNVPKLTKGAEVVPYMKWQSYERLNAQRNQTCKEENLVLPEPVLLPPNEPTMADWFVLVDGRTPTGAEAWYDPLPPGKYELTIQRRFACCDGPMLTSNKISFEVVP
jgi:hypothetical protein